MRNALIAIASIAVAACASTRPPQELVDARSAYARAYEGPAAEANPGGLGDARRALDEAEAKFADDPGSEEARNLAYVAHRRILVAETNARASIAAAQRAHAEQTLAQLKARPRIDDRAAESTGQEKARTSNTPKP